jgi:long-chain acyl-CoA synthetase
MFIKNYHNTAIIENGEEVSYSDLLREITFFTTLFKIRGSQERVIVCFENRSEWFYSFLAAWKSDAVPVPVDYLSTAEEISYILKDCTPKVAFHSNKTKEAVENAVKLYRKKIKLINVDEIDDRHSEFDVEELEALDETKTAAIIYTSGTTGSPKGVMLSYDNFIANVESVSCDEAPFYNSSQRIMVMLPLHHVFPITGTFLIVLNLGATAVFCPEISGEAILNTLQTYNINLLIGVPRLFEMIAKGIENKINQSAVARVIYTVAKVLQWKGFSRVVFKKVHEKFGSGLEFIISGGAPLDVRYIKIFKTLGIDLIEGYGMTEASPMISCPRPGNIKPGFVGLPIKETEVSIIDGEICFRGRNMMKGYYNRPDETADVIRDGWLHTGDLGYIDKDGFLKITGRKKEIIVLPNGKNYNPVEIEKKILSISAVIEEIGIFEKDGKLHTMVRVNDDFISKHKIENVSEYIRSEVINTYNSSVAPYKKLSHIHFVTVELPRTRLQKLKRHKLAELLDNPDNLQDLELPEFDEYKLLAEYLKQEIGREVKPNEHIDTDLGMDSLSKVSLIAYIKNTFGVDLSEALLNQYSHIIKLAEFLNKNKNKKALQSVIKPDWNSILNDDDTSVKLTKSRFPHITAKHILTFFLHVITSVKTRGMENLPAAPFIVSPNHQSNLDWIILASSLKTSVMRKTYIFAKEKHFKQKWRKWMATRSNIIVMDITKDLHDSIKKMAVVLKSGNNLVIFPEGTRSHDGTLGEFKKSFAILSKELSVPIVPVVIDGAIKVLPPDKKFPRFFQKIHVNYLTPMYPGNYDYDEITQRVKNVMKEKLNQN